VDAELERWKGRGQWFDYLGFEVFFVRDGSGPQLVLIHGYPFSSFDWLRIWPTLRERFSLIAPDMLGMGFSAKPARYEYSVHDHADMHEALLDYLGVSECHVLAHDIGDSVAQELLARHEFAEQSGARFEIKSITWLNGGLFNEAYSPRPIQKLLSTTPLGEVFARYRPRRRAPRRPDRPLAADREPRRGVGPLPRIHRPLGGRSSARPDDGCRRRTRRSRAMSHSSGVGRPVIVLVATRPAPATVQPAGLTDAQPLSVLSSPEPGA